jgi:hypothetical protein
MGMSFKYAMVATECGRMKVYLSDEREALDTLIRNTKSGGEAHVVIACAEPEEVYVDEINDAEVQVVSAFDGDDEVNRKGPL